MGRGLRHFVLVFSILLATVCNMVNVTFCECRQSLIVGDCSCAVHSHSVSCVDSSGQGDSVPCQVIQHSHQCRHVMMDNGNWEFPAAVDVSQGASVPCFIIVSPCDLGDNALVCLGLVREVYYPPDWRADSYIGGLGYCRPLLI